MPCNCKCADISGFTYLIAFTSPFYIVQVHLQLLHLNELEKKVIICHSKRELQREIPRRGCTIGASVMQGGRGSEMRMSHHAPVTPTLVCIADSSAITLHPTVARCELASCWVFLSQFKCSAVLDILHWFAVCKPSCFLSLPVDNKYTQ